MAKQYTDGLKVGEYLGRTLTPDEYATVDERVPAVEAYIDRVTGRSWLDPTPTVGEQYPVFGPRLYLKRRPVLTVVAILVASWPGAEPVGLTVDQFTLVDAARGLVWVPAYTGYAWVDYTHAGPPLPADLALAATMLAAHWLPGGGGGGAAGGIGADVKMYSVGQELIVERFESAAALAGTVPSEVTAIVSGYASARMAFA